MAEGRDYGEGDLVKSGKNFFYKRWLISLIILPFGIFFTFFLALSGTGYSGSLNLIV